jgi:hypothetical protein
VSDEDGQDSCERRRVASNGLLEAIQVAGIPPGARP